MSMHSGIGNRQGNAWSIRVRGRVQGVGFRPTVYKLAVERGIKGHVLNDGEGVLIEAWADDKTLEEFVEAIRLNSPPLARIESIEHANLAQANLHDNFVISKSADGSAKTDISPDAATCSACVEDVFSPFSRRFRYPFTNCTHCGPRLSIIKSIPYDRASTSMSVFTMCSACQAEYEDPADRRDVKTAIVSRRADRSADPATNLVSDGERLEK